MARASEKSAPVSLVPTNFAEVSVARRQTELLKSPPENAASLRLAPTKLTNGARQDCQTEPSSLAAAIGLTQIAAFEAPARQVEPGEVGLLTVAIGHDLRRAPGEWDEVAARQRPPRKAARRKQIVHSFAVAIGDNGDQSYNQKEWRLTVTLLPSVTRRRSANHSNHVRCS
jgi:hypothetical protein